MAAITLIYIHNTYSSLDTHILSALKYNSSSDLINGQRSAANHILDFASGHVKESLF